MYMTRSIYDVIVNLFMSFSGNNEARIEEIYNRGESVRSVSHEKAQAPSREAQFVIDRDFALQSVLKRKIRAIDCAHPMVDFLFKLYRADIDGEIV